MQNLPCLSLVASCLLLALLPAKAAPVINEIMFHPQGTPAEDPAKEWIEIYNPSTTTAVDVSGWKLSKGVSFTIPAATPALQPGGYLVIAANVAAFQAEHLGFAGQLVGGWTGQLAGGGEQIQLDDAAGVKVNDVTYADEGDWAVRGRGVLSFSHRGWSWYNDADGLGKTLELRNAALGNGNGQNWGVSAAMGGSPGGVNSVATLNVAPLIKDVKHRPEIPRTTDPIVVSCNLENETAGATATMRWRLDGAGSFNMLAMSDTDGDGDVEATIPAQTTNLTVVEWYISAADGALVRTWPAPARTSDPGVQPETFGQVTNALVQVDNGFVVNTDFTGAGAQPIYRLIMTDAERAELAQIGSTNGQEDSEATMNGTFISHDGTGIKVVYNAGFRNRGLGSALGPPNNFHAGFRSDDLWNGRASLALNCQYGYSQALGNALFERAGVPPQDTAIVRVRVNGADLAQAGALMYGRYARVEGRGGDWTERHYPNDPDGNFYRLDDHAYSQGDPLSGEFRYEGADPTLYADTFFKETNKDANDYSDLINFARIVSAPATGGTAGQPAIADSAYVAAISAVLDVEQFYRFIATDALIGNQEGGLQSGRADDTSIYRGVVDPRFRFIPHDMDDVFNIGNGVGDPVTRSLFSYDISGGGVTGLPRLFNHPALVPRYYAAVLEALNTWFTSATVDPIIDQIMAGWVPASNGASGQADSIAEIKAFVAARRANVLTQIQQNYSLTVTAAGTAVDGNQRTNDGAATFSGTFNVAKTYSITVNGVLATWSYRGGTAGTWSLATVAGGSGVLSPGLNTVVVRFWDGLGGTGNVVQELTTKVLWQPASVVYTNVSGTLAPAGSLAMTVPASYIPGIPFLVKMDLKDAAGNLDRTAWNRTATLTATGGVTLNPATIALTNGMGSALVTVGGGAGGTISYYTYGTGGTGTTATVSGVPGNVWRVKGDYTNATIGAHPATWANEGFDDSTWITRPSQTGHGNSDENQSFPRVDYDAVQAGTQSGPSYFFRSTFTIADLNALASVTGQIKYDDAYRIYVNGVKVLNSLNLPDGTPITSYATAASSDNMTAGITIPLANLHVGVNTIAVEIHQASATSGDVTFDLRLQGNLPASDPGNFTLTSAVGALSANKALTSLTPTPAMTNVSGTLAAGTTNWSGVINVTGDVTVPATGTLNIAPGTHVLVAGTPFGGGGSSGTDIIVQAGGIMNAAGTAAQPISITCSDAANRWGEFTLQSNTTAAANGTWQFCLVSRAAHSPAGGHTATGPIVRLTGNNQTLQPTPPMLTVLVEDSVFSDSPGKTLTNTGNTTMTMRRSHFARCVMGPETDNSTTTIEDCNFTEMLPVYRESGAADDEDSIYIHNAGNQPVNLRRSVFSNSGDDGIDLLAGAVTVEDCIIRNILDKGMSLLQNNVTVRRTQIVDCDFCVSTKTQIGSEATPYTLTMENCTLIGEVHPTNQGDQSGGTYWHSVGVHVRNKYGTGPNVQLFVNMKNCIVSAITPMLNDYPVGPNNFPLLTSTYNCYEDVAGTNPVDPAVPAGTGDISAVPLFVDGTSKDFHLQAGSPCRNTGDPASPLDPDGTRADMGALPFGTSSGGAGTLTWTPAGGPYRVTANTTVPANLVLTIQAGTAVYFDQNVRLAVLGNVQALGTPSRRITFSSVPGVIAAGDCDPLKFGTQTGAPKWGGIRVTDSRATESVFKYCDFINAQGTDPATSENYGSLGFIRSWGFCEGLTFAGTHLRMLYGRNPKLTVIRCTFPDMFIFDPVLGRIEEPTTDFIAAADNRMEPLKVEYPVEAESTGAGWSANGLPIGGWWRVYYNQFNGNRGHQDVFDADSGRVTVANDFILDCRYNHFRGLAGDEHIDLGGDAYIASNIFENARKDFWTNDTGYSNAISSGDKGTGTTILVARNVCYDLDHVINLKASTATIFEHNTVANFHADFQFVGSTVTQNVICAPINFFVPGDGGAPTNGDGAYTGFNIISNVPHVFSSPDISSGGAITTKIEFFNNLLDQIADANIGPNHPGGFFSGTYGPNQAGAPGFVNPTGEDYSLAVTSVARGSAPGGFDYGASIPEWAYIVGGPGGTTAATSAAFTIGGAGIVAYKWRLDGGAWSAETVIGSGPAFPRTVGVPCVRQAVLNLASLAPGAHTLEVLGKDMAGNWQDADPARTVIGAAQATPTVRTWTVDTTSPLIRITEVLAESATLADTIELQNQGATTVDLGGWTLTDDPLVPAKYTIPSMVLNPGAFVTFTATTTAIALDHNGDTVQLRNGAVLVDAVSFGNQIADLTIGRSSITGAWTLCTPTLGAANVTRQLGDANVVRINEWFTSGDVLYDADWIELRNASALPVDLSGLRLTDNRVGDPLAHTFAPLTFIPANGYARFIADGATAQGLSHLGFSLDAEQENISLSSAAGALLDTITFFPQTTDYSMGRDALGNYVFYELPTREFLNGTGDPAYVNALAILRGLRISEIMFNAIGGSDFDYVELTNTGATPLALAGVSFVQGITFTFPAMTLNPGEYVVVAKHLAKFRSRYGNAPVVAGIYTGQLDNGGETLGLQLPPPFDANTLTFAYSDAWYPPTDGFGPSLVVPNAGVKANVWGDRGTWSASAVNGGNPGGVLATLLTYSGFSARNAVQSVIEDIDFDSIGALMEFSLGQDITNPNGSYGVAGLPLIGRAGDGRATLSFLVPEVVGAVQSHGYSDVTYRVQAADILGIWTNIATKTYTTAWSASGTVNVGAASGGYVPVTIGDLAPLGTPPRWLRLQMSWTP